MTIPMIRYQGKVCTQITFAQGSHHIPQVWLEKGHTGMLQ